MSLKPPPPPVKSEPGSFAWMDWYKKLYDYLNTAGSVIWTTIDFTGSKLTDIATRLHSSLQGLLGTGQYHISLAEATEVTALLTQTGTGAFVRATSPSLVTPALGTPSALVGTNITGTAAGLTSGGNALLAGSSSQTFAASTLTTSTAGSSVVVEAFIVPTLLNSWVNYSAVYNDAGYYKDAFGIVHLKGLVKSGTVGSPIFTLPVGYRPGRTEVFATTSNAAHGEISVSSIGEVILAVGSNSYASLDGLTFRV